MQVNILEAKNRFSELVKSAQAGEEVIIANRGVPMARLVPAGAFSATSELSVSGGNIVAWLKAHPLPAHVRRGHDEIEAALHEERAAWD